MNDEEQENDEKWTCTADPIPQEWGFAHLRPGTLAIHNSRPRRDTPRANIRPSVASASHNYALSSHYPAPPAKLSTLPHPSPPPRGTDSINVNRRQHKDDQTRCRVPINSHRRYYPQNITAPPQPPTHSPTMGHSEDHRALVGYTGLCCLSVCYCHSLDEQTCSYTGCHHTNGS